MMKRWIVSIDKYLRTHADTTLAKISGGNPYKAMCKHLFCENRDEIYEKLEPGLFGEPDFKGALERIVGIDLTIK